MKTWGGLLYFINNAQDLMKKFWVGETAKMIFIWGGILSMTILLA